MNWDSGLPEFERALRWYSTAIKECEKSTEKKTGLVDLDTELWTKLGTEARKRSPAHIESAEYCRLVKWKLKRGKWRPRLQRFADELAPSLIKEASSKALASLEKGDTRDALKALVELRGCGPATASAVLAACDGNVPFMSDELLSAVFNGKRDYTIPSFLRLIDRVQLKSEQLGVGWNARKIEHAMFAAAIAKQVGKEDELLKDLDEVPYSEKNQIDVENEPTNEKVAKRTSKKRARKFGGVENTRKSARLSQKN